MNTRPIVLASLILGTASVTAVAQVIRVPGGGPSPAQCAAAADTLRTGSLTAQSNQSHAYMIAHGCRDAWPAIAVAMERRRDASFSTDMARMFSPTVADSSMLRVALALAGDRTVGVPARVLSLGLLLAYIGTDAASGYHTLRATPEGDLCIAGGVLEGPLYHTSTLPPDTRARIRPVVAPIETDVSQPLEVRSAANCVMNVFRTLDELPGQVLLPDPRTILALEYVCGRRFRIKNTSSHWISVQYEVAGVAGRKPLKLVGKEAGQDYGVTELDLETGGELRIVFDGQIILTKPNGGTSCT